MKSLILGIVLTVGTSSISFAGAIPHFSKRDFEVQNGEPGHVVSTDVKGKSSLAACVEAAAAYINIIENGYINENENRVEVSSVNCQVENETQAILTIKQKR